MSTAKKSVPPKKASKKPAKKSAPAPRVKVRLLANVTACNFHLAANWRGTLPADVAAAIIADGKAERIY